jgi:3-oxoacyl-[acyl-carrier-protein] synthase-3
MTVAGVISYGLYLPAASEPAGDLSARTGIPVKALHALGIRAKYLPAPDDQPVSMAARAAAQALARAENFEPQAVDVVIYTGEEYKDYIAQTAAIRLQEEVGCKNAYAFDLVGQGVTSIVGLRVARDLMIGDETVRNVLLAGGTRNVDLVDGSRAETRFLLPYSASGAALLLGRDHGRNRLLGTAFKVDSEWADEVYVPGGGTSIPFGPDNLNSELMYYQVNHPEELNRYLRETWPMRLIQTARQALDGIPPDYLALRHVNPAARDQILSAFGLGPHESASLENVGHHGPNDIVISLDMGLKTGAVQNGSSVGLVSGGIGFSYAAAALRWG